VQGDYCRATPYCMRRTFESEQKIELFQMEKMNIRESVNVIVCFSQVFIVQDN